MSCARVESFASNRPGADRVHVACNLCGADDAVFVFETSPRVSGNSDSNFTATSDRLGSERLVRCRRCDLVYLNPQPHPRAVLDAYSEGEDARYVEQMASRMRTFRGYWRSMQPHLPSTGRALDVGAAAGFFMRIAEEHGWKASGVEPNAWLRRFARERTGVSIEAATLQAAPWSDAYFDLVTFWDVLEHLSDPASAVKEAARLLKPGGLLVVNWPDISDPLAKLFGRRWWFLLSAHLFYFTPQTLTALIARRGFEVFAVKRHVQYLPLGYLAIRAKSISAMFGALAGLAVRLGGLSQAVVPYYAGQRCLFARRIRD